MSPTLIFRLSTAADAHKLSALARAVFAETYGANLPAEVLQEHLEHHLSSRVISQELSSGQCIYLIAEENGDLAGLVKLEVTPSPPEVGANAIEMVKCYVSSDYRSSNVADTLMEMALKRAVSQGFNAIWLLVWKENPRAVRFYTKHGFAAIGTQPVWVGDIAFDDHIMKKVLTS